MVSRPASSAARRIDAALAAEATLGELARETAALPAYSGGSNTLYPAQRIRKRIAQLCEAQHPDGVRDRAERLLAEFEARVISQGYPAWWRKQREELRRQRQTRVAQAAKPVRPPSAQRDEAAMAALPILSAEVDKIVEFQRSKTRSLMKLRSRIRKYSGPDYGPDVQAAAGALCTRFAEIVTRLGYQPWWENEQAAVTAGNRSPRWRGQATR